jgi:hypothetical protein
VHLTDTDSFGDLRLRQPAEVPQRDDVPLTARETVEEIGKYEPIVDRVEIILDTPDAPLFQLVERLASTQAMRSQREDRLAGFGSRPTTARRELVDGRRTSQSAGEPFEHCGCFEASLVHRTRRTDDPGAVAQVTFESADDGRTGETREGDAARWIEALDSLGERDQGDLPEVLPLLP